MKNPIFYIESHTDLIVGGPCDGMRTVTPFNSQHAIVMLQPPPAESTRDPSFRWTMQEREMQDIIFEVQAPVPYHIATLCVPDGTLQSPVTHTEVDRVIRIWYRKFQELSETEAIALLFKNYKRQEETCNPISYL